jgi:hypothetical protein
MKLEAGKVLLDMDRRLLKNGFAPAGDAGRRGENRVPKRFESLGALSKPVRR